MVGRLDSGLATLIATGFSQRHAGQLAAISPPATSSSSAHRPTLSDRGHHQAMDHCRLILDVTHREVRSLRQRYLITSLETVR